MKTKNRNTIGMIAFITIIFMSINILNVDAILQEVDISQTPSLDSVTSNDVVKVIVVITTSPIDDREKLVFAELRYTIDGLTQTAIVYAIDEPITISPSLTLKFTFRAFEKGSEIEYTIHLEYLIDRLDYESEIYSFSVKSADSNTNLNTVYIIIAVIVGVALISIVVIKKIRN